VKILVLQLKRIGDLVLTTPALAALREHFPDAKITLAVAEGCAGLLPAMPGVTETLVFRRNSPNMQTWLRMAFSGFDACLDFTGNDRSALFSALSKAKTRATFSWVQKSRGRSLFYNRFIDSPVRDFHTIDHYLALLEAVGTPTTPRPPVLRIPEETAARAARLAEGALSPASWGVHAVDIEDNVPPHGSGPFVLVHPGTARPEKYWLPQRWAEIIDLMSKQHGLPCVLSGSPDVFEQEHIAKILARTTERVANLSGKLDLLTVAALTQQATLVLTVDSAPMHFASCFGTPQVALFGPTNPFHWHPRHERAAVILAGHPGVLREFTPRTRRGAMSEISTEQVSGAIEAAMKQAVRQNPTNGH
jgi:ADP-heptose:LPS heptosyltransferase